MKITTLTQHELFSKLSHAYILCASITFFIMILLSPIQNWDILGYVGSAYSLDNKNSAQVHKRVYEGFKKYSSDKSYKQITRDGNYRKTMLNNSELFSLQLPFYKIRLTFVFLINKVTAFSRFNIFKVSHFLAATFISLGLLVFYYSYRTSVYPALWLVVPLFFLMFGLHNTGRAVTADTIAFFWVAIISFTFLHKKWILFFPVLIFSVLMRTDLIILVALFSLYIFIFKPNLRLAAIVTLLLSVTLYLMISKHTHNYGWGTVFYYAIISKMSAVNPLEYSSDGISLSQYLTALKAGAKSFFLSTPFLLFQAMVILQFITFKITLGRNISARELLNHTVANHYLVLTIISILYILAHYMIFPLLSYRFFIGQYLSAALSFLVFLSLLIKAYKIEVN